MAQPRVLKDIWDRTEFVIARVHEDGDVEKFDVDHPVRVPRDAEIVDTVVTDLDGAIHHARRVLKRRVEPGMALVSTIPDYRINDKGDTFDPNADAGATYYTTEAAFRTYIVPEE
jgi:hypothetical protein